MQPDTTGVIPVLPEPWRNLLPITTLTDPSLSFVPSSTSEPTFAPTSSPIETPSPTTSSTLNPTPSLTTSTNQEPSPLTAPAAYVAIALIAVIVGLLVYFKKTQAKIV